MEFVTEDAELVLCNGLLGIGGASSIESANEDVEGVLCSGLTGMGGASSTASSSYRASSLLREDLKLLCFVSTFGL